MGMPRLPVRAEMVLPGRARYTAFAALSGPGLDGFVPPQTRYMFAPGKARAEPSAADLWLQGLLVPPSPLGAGEKWPKRHWTCGYQDEPAIEAVRQPPGYSGPLIAVS